MRLKRVNQSFKVSSVRDKGLIQVGHKRGLREESESHPQALLQGWEPHTSAPVAGLAEMLA